MEQNFRRIEEAEARTEHLHVEAFGNRRINADMEQSIINSEVYSLLSNYVADYFLNKNTEITQENLQTAFNNFINKFYNV